MSTTILVWEEVPENTTLYAIPSTAISQLQAMDLEMAAGHFINNTEDAAAEAALDRISMLLDGAAEGPWVQYKIDGLKVVGSFDRVVVCGFIL